MKRLALVLVGIVVGAAIGTGATLALADDEPESTAGPRILCETDAGRIAQEFEASQLDTNVLINCQQATGTDESPLAGASLEPEYRCFLRAQVGTNPYLLDCAPMPGPPTR